MEFNHSTSVAKMEARGTTAVSEYWFSHMHINIEKKKLISKASREVTKKLKINLLAGKEEESTKNNLVSN